MSGSSSSSLFAAVALALGVGLLVRQGQQVADTGGADLGSPRFELVERDGRPWLLWVGERPSAVEFQMESHARFEVIGSADEARRSHVVELAGWLGRGPVQVLARPSEGEPPLPLELAPRDVAPYLDRLARAVVARGDEDAWRRLGRFAELYFTTSVGDLEVKRRLQEHLVADPAGAGPGGARWLWGADAAPARRSALPGAPLALAPEVQPRSAGPGEPGMVTTLPAIDSEDVEVQVQVEVSPTPAEDYHLVATLAGGWPVLLAPGPEGGEAFQRLDPRALQAGEAGTEVTVTVHAGPGAPPDLRVSPLRLGLRHLPRAADELARANP